MAEKIDLKALAKLFGMTVVELAKFMGYTKQALYQINDGTSGICTSRYFEALQLLQFENEKLYDSDMQKAQELKRKREWGKSVALARRFFGLPTVPEYDVEAY